MKFSRGKLGGLGLIFAGLARIIQAIAGNDGQGGDAAQGIVEGVGSIAAGVGLIGIRDKQERSDPESPKF